MVAATFAAEIVLTPIAASLFGQVTCAGLLLNLAAIPLMTVVQAASLATLGAWHVDAILARACGYVVHAAALNSSLSPLVDTTMADAPIGPPAWSSLRGITAPGALAASHARVTSAAAAAALLGTLIVVAPTADPRRRTVATSWLVAHRGS